MFDVLGQHLLPVTTARAGLILTSLPQLFELYGEDEISAHAFLRPHQRHPWHAFCVQLAALALHGAGEFAVDHDAERWQNLLRGLTADWPGDEPWSLVVEDLAQPAFLQPAVPEGTLAGFKNEIGTPDDLDVLVTSKNHGVKQGQGAGSSPAEWIAALVSLQTTGGFLGAGNYGVARMNGGFATRPGIALVPEGGPGARWQRDVTLLLSNRDWFFERLAEFRDRGGAALLWCWPWDGRSSLGVDALDPWFVEVCRRVRLARRADGMLVGRATTTSAARIAAAPFKGNLADPWIPINKEKESAAYNSLPTYAVMSEVLFDDGKWVRPLLLDWHPEVDGAPMIARFDVFVRGQGRTEGYHERLVPMRREMLLRLSRPDERERLAKLAREMIESVRTVLGGKMLRTALLALVQGGPDQVNFGDRTAGAWADKFLKDANREVDRVFFDHLFARAEDDHGGQLQWLRFLKKLAWDTFERAVDAVPLAGARRPRAIAVAERILRGADFGTGMFAKLRPAREENADAA